MTMHVSGSMLSVNDIQKLKKHFFNIDLMITFNSIKRFSLNNTDKYFIDLNTCQPVLIRNNSNCLITSINENNAYVIVGTYTFKVHKNEILDLN